MEANLVQEFVGNAHGDQARVQGLLASEPALINDCWDWGGSDFETGLGAGGDEARNVLEFLGRCNNQ